ncbi:unnamed protein product [Wuchereria bancrofti]|uniref:G-protein coupled receptors family 1 profile domain-containing protein n=1 Tax=Wuchereria bancrofti TaxID=6293 RepID=A0A3P7E100_WUCBA|nr:unnamed protein product [Wuchereria bancrofti]
MTISDTEASAINSQLDILKHQNRLFLFSEKQVLIPSDIISSQKPISFFPNSKQRERLFTDNMIVRYYCIVALFLISPLNCHEENATNVFDIRDEQHIIIKYTVATVIFFSATYGIISNFLMATVCYSRNNLYGRPFIFIVSQIVISNLVTLIPYVIILLPGMLLSENYAYIAWMNDAFCKVRAYSTVVMVYFSFLLTLNRFVVIVLPKCNVFFQSTKLYFLLLLVWLISFGMIY